MNIARNTATSIDEIGKIIDSIGKKNIGVCLDTCHAFAAGYDISTKNGTENLMDEIEGSIGLEKVKCIHLNDSRYKLGSGLDRHWHIGEGFIGKKGFVEFFRNNRLDTEYFIMETPFQKENDDIKNIDMAKKLMAEAEYTL